MSKRVYKRERLRLSEFHIERAMRDHAAGLSKDSIVELCDQDTPGLALRLLRTKAVWYLRRRDMTVVIGDLSDFNLDGARYIARQANLAAGRHRDLRVFVRTMAELDRQQYKDTWSWKVADEVADDKSPLGRRRLMGDVGPVWTWAAMTNHFLAYKLPKLKDRYRSGYEAYLRLPSFKSLDEMLVPEVRIRDLERVRDDIFSHHSPSTVHRAVQQAKSMLSWAWRYHAARSGLDRFEHEWWLRWSFEYSSSKRTRTPTIQELARTLAVAEKHRTLSEEEHETFSGTLGAFWAVILTAQRTGSLTVLRVDRLADPNPADGLGEGWKVAAWTADEMKGGKDGGRQHALPIPPQALKILKGFHDEGDPRSPWMFPSGKAGGQPVTQSALNRLMYRLQGKTYDQKPRRKPDRSGKPGPKPKTKPSARKNLLDFYGIEPWTLHDIRRTLTNYLDDHRLGGAATAILGHKTPGKDVPERERMAPITKLHYNTSQRIGLKAEGMALWVDAVLAAYEVEKAVIDATKPVRAVA